MGRKRWRSLLCIVTAAVIVSVGSFSSSAAYTGKVYMFTYNAGQLPSYFYDYHMSTRKDAEWSLPWLWDMNYDAGEYLNNSVDAIYSAMPNASILTLSSHGDAGFVHCPDANSEYAPRYTRLTGKYYGFCPEYSKALERQADLSRTKLMIFASCNSGLYDSNYGNLLDEAVNRGAGAALGWKNEIPMELMPSHWLEYFFRLAIFCIVM